MIINIAKDYSLYPGGRYIKHGEFAGEDFRQKMLLPKYQEAVKTGEMLVINFDGGYGYATSFLEEAFGGLVRELKDSKVREKLEFISNEDREVIAKVNEYIEDAVKQL